MQLGATRTKNDDPQNVALSPEAVMLLEQRKAHLPASPSLCFRNWRERSSGRTQEGLETHF